MTAKTAYGVIIGRFQCANLTGGHIALINEVVDRHGFENTIIIVGDRKTPATSTNPLSYECRKIMIERVYPGIQIMRQWDCRTNEEWSTSLDALIGGIVRDKSVTLYHGRDSFQKHYLGKYPTEEINTGIICTATEHRQDIAKNPLFYSRTFREGIIYAHSSQWPRFHTTVDIAVMKGKPMDHQLLLGRKPNETEWRFPGGFVENNETFEQAARRELKEETGLDCELVLRNLGDFIIDDWRVRDAKGEVTHRTVLFLAEYIFGVTDPKAADDLKDVQWWAWKNVKPSMLVKEHRQLMMKLKTIYP